MKRNDDWFVYIIECKNNSFYTGISKNVKRRFFEHQFVDKKASKYCLRLRPLKLRYVSVNFTNRSDASKEEYRIRKLSRNKKLLLISEKQNERTSQNP